MVNQCGKSIFHGFFAYNRRKLRRFPISIGISPNKLLRDKSLQIWDQFLFLEEKEYLLCSALTVTVNLGDSQFLWESRLTNWFLPNV
jgi:hypothetical protein